MISLVAALAIKYFYKERQLQIAVLVMKTSDCFSFVNKFLVVASIVFWTENSYSQQPKAVTSSSKRIVTNKASFDIQHLLLDLHVDWINKKVFGKSTIRFNTSSLTSEIILDAAYLTIKSVKSGDGNILRFKYDSNSIGNNLKILFDEPLTANRSAEVSIEYHSNWINHSDINSLGGSFGKGLRFFGPTSSNPNKRRQLWSSGEACSNRYWFPSKDDPEDIRTTELFCTVEKSLSVISNGTLQEIKINADSTRTFHYKSDRPHSNFLTSLVVGEYINVQRRPGNVSLNSFGYPDEKEAIEATIVRLPDMVNYFAELTGKNLHNNSYTQVMVQDYPFPGLTGQHGASIISDNMIDGYTTHADFFYLWDGVEAQALASQWFGNTVMIKRWQDMWLNASFAHYLDGLYTDSRNGHDEYLSWYHSFDNAAVLADWDNGYRHPIVPKVVDDIESFVGDNYTRLRGALVLRMLRKELGDEIWWKFIKLYVDKYSDKQVQTTDLIQLINIVSGKKMNWFFEQWVYKMGLPEFTVSKNYDAASRQLTIHLRQVQKPDVKSDAKQVVYFQGHIDIEIDGELRTFWLKAQRDNKLVVVLNRAPRLINVDFENTWIRKIQFRKSTAELVYQLANSKDILARWSAIDQLVALANDLKTGDSTKQVIYASLKSIASGNSYWRLRGYALFQLRQSIFKTGKELLDTDTRDLLLRIIKEERSWLKAGAITFLGLTNDSTYTDLYLQLLNDSSDRVVNAAAIALGKTKSSKAFNALVELKGVPSWKSQTLISALNGLKELNDARGAGIALEAIKNNTLPRWWLATPVWDYPLAAAQTLVALGETEKAYDIVSVRLRQSLEEDDRNDIFSNLLLLTALKNQRVQEHFPVMRKKFNGNKEALKLIDNYEEQVKAMVKAK